MNDNILTSPELAKVMGVARNTLWRWACKDPRLNQCVLRRTKCSTYWSVQRLVDNGFLKMKQATESSPALTYSMRIVQ